MAREKHQTFYTKQIKHLRILASLPWESFKRVLYGVTNMKNKGVCLKVHQQVEKQIMKESISTKLTDLTHVLISVIIHYYNRRAPSLRWPHYLYKCNFLRCTNFAPVVTTNLQVLFSLQSNNFEAHWWMKTEAQWKNIM